MYSMCMKRCDVRFNFKLQDQQFISDKEILYYIAGIVEPQYKHLASLVHSNSIAKLTGTKG